MKLLENALAWSYLQIKWFYIRWRIVYKWLKSQLITILGLGLFCIKVIRRIFKNEIKQQQSKDNVAIIVPMDFSLEAPNFNGGTKDIQSMLEQISELGISYRVFFVPRKTTHALYVLLRDQNKFFSASDILLSIPGSSGLLLPYLRFLGFSNLIFRSHNAELLHRWDWVKSSKSIPGFLKSLKKISLGFLSDFLVSIFSFKILSVSEKEIEIYWKVFFPWSKRKVEYFPVTSPSHIRDKYQSKEHERKSRSYATIIGGFDSDTMISKADRSFIQYGPEICKYFNSHGLRLVSIGNMQHFDFCDFNFGYSSNFLEVMKNTEVVIVPSSRGWGFKTKIGDAVTLHQSVVVTEKLNSRLGSWSQMVSPILDWSDFSNFKIKTLSTNEYQEFLSHVLHLRDKILRETFKR